MNEIIVTDLRDLVPDLQREHLRTGCAVIAVDRSAQLQIAFVCGNNEYCIRLSTVKTLGNSMKSWMTMAERRELASHISRNGCIREYGASPCLCGSDICTVTEVLES